MKHAIVVFNKMFIFYFLSSFLDISFMQAQPSGTPWYKNSFIYSLEVATFKDSDGDGIGDFKGLTSKLGYLDTLGVDVLWLSPIMPSPGKDDGYDVTDYSTINPKFGTEQDFIDFLGAANDRSMRVVMDLVLNHTSIEHPWYEQARKEASSPYHAWYVWADKQPKDAKKGMVFPGVQKETWTYDSVARKYYFHRFYDFQPDLNYTNPQVQQEGFKILQYWLKKGVDGYRLDAVPFIIDVPETGSEKPERMLYLVPAMRDAVKAVKDDALLLGEANLSPKENKDYFGEDNKGMQMMFNFYANQYLFYALASEDLKYFRKAIKGTKEKPEAAQWAFFLRNHDEIDLDRLGDKKKKLVYSKFGPAPTMQIYDRGIRRRLAPMLNNAAQLRMAYSLLFALPGAPVIRYGEEIGMGDDLSLQERLSVRTPMQWNGAANAGFSSGSKAFRPVIKDGPYAYQYINVAEQLRDTGSLLSHIKNLVYIRRLLPEIGLGDFKILKASSKYVFVIKYEHMGKRVLILHNFSREPQHFTIKGMPKVYRLEKIVGSSQALTSKAKEYDLDGYGYVWFEVE